MKDLKENLYGKHGFLYKIESDEDELYYHIGQCIFYECTDLYTIHKYNKLMEYIENNNAEEIRHYFKSIIRRSEFGKREEEHLKLKKEVYEFIDNLDYKQYKNLEEQVKMFENLFYKYGR